VLLAVCKNLPLVLGCPLEDGEDAVEHAPEQQRVARPGPQVKLWRGELCYVQRSGLPNAGLPRL